MWVTIPTRSFFHTTLSLSTGCHLLCLCVLCICITGFCAVFLWYTLTSFRLPLQRTILESTHLIHIFLILQKLHKPPKVRFYELQCSFYSSHNVQWNSSEIMVICNSLTNLCLLPSSLLRLLAHMFTWFISSKSINSRFRGSHTGGCGTATSWFGRLSFLSTAPYAVRT